jgi:hypothetical protein
MLAALLLILALFGTIVGLGYSHFRPRWHLGSQAPGGHSTASGAAELHARTHQYIATIFAASRLAQLRRFSRRMWKRAAT